MGSSTLRAIWRNRPGCTSVGHPSTLRWGPSHPISTDLVRAHLPQAPSSSLACPIIWVTGIADDLISPHVFCPKNVILIFVYNSQKLKCLKCCQT